MRRLVISLVIGLAVFLFGSASQAQTQTAPPPTPPAETSTAPAPPPQPVATTSTPVSAPAPPPIAATSNPEMATVYIYRPKAFMGMALHPTMMLDGKDLINVANGTVWLALFNPGHYVFQMDDKRSGAELDLKAGESYYMKVEIVPGMWKGGGKMTLMMKEQGSLEIKDLKPLPAKEGEHPMFKK